MKVKSLKKSYEYNDVKFSDENFEEMNENFYLD
jgi:hypothetical protein